MIIELTKEQHRMLRDDYLEINGEELECVESSEDMDDNGRTKTIIWKRASDNKFFAVDVFYCRYGYEDYGYESDMQDFDLYEVKKEEVITYKWVYVKEDN